MKSFDSIVNSKWSGKRISFDKNTVIVHRNAAFGQTINIGKGNHVIRVVGKKRNGNGKVNISITAEDGTHIFSDSVIFTKNSWTEYSFTFSSKKNFRRAQLRFARESGVIGTLEIGRVIIDEDASSAPSLVRPPAKKPSYKPRSKRKRNRKPQQKQITAKKPEKIRRPIRPVEKKSIAFVIPYGIYGGAEVYIKNLILGLDRKIYDISILYIRSNALQSHLGLDYVKHSVIRDLEHLGGILINQKFDFIVYYNRESIYQTLLSLIDSNKIHSTLVEIYHSDFVWSGALSRVRERKNVKVLFTISNNLAKDISGVENRVTLPVGIDLSKFNRRIINPSNMNINLPQNSKYIIGTVARLSPEKNIEYIIDLAQEMKDCLFLIIGEGPSRGGLEAKIKALGLNNVRLLGFKLDVHRYYNLFDGFILASKIEGLPISIIEAMASEVPVFSNMVGAIPDAVKDGITGFKICQDVVTDSKIIRDNIQNKNVIKKAKEYALKNHDIGKNVEIFSRALFSANSLYIKNIKDKNILILNGEYL